MSLWSRLERIEAELPRALAPRLTLFWAVFIIPPAQPAAFCTESYRPYGATGGPAPSEWWPNICYGAEHVQAWQERGFECVLLFDPSGYDFGADGLMPHYRPEHAIPFRGYVPGTCLKQVIADLQLERTTP